MKVRRAGAEDAELLAKIDETCFTKEGDHYEARVLAYRKELAENQYAIYLIASVDDEDVAYAGIWIVPGDANIPGSADLINIAVMPEFRRMHLAYGLMTRLFMVMKMYGIFQCTLEVRRSNIAAIRLYEMLGFKVEGVRKKYYSDKEDAIIMWRRAAE